jgi:hypothetical protein
MKKTMETYFSRFGKRKGVSGESTDSDVRETKDQFQDLVNFDKLDHPFELSIEKMINFHH